MPHGTSLATFVNVHVPNVPIQATMSGGQLTSGLSSQRAFINPSESTGLVMWFDASSISGIVSGASLSVWTDVSGSGFHLTAPSAVSSPTWVAAGQKGLGVVRFNDVNKAVLNNSAVSLPAGITQFAAFKVVDVAGALGFVCGGDPGGSINSGRAATLQLVSGDVALQGSAATVDSNISTTGLWVATCGIYAGSSSSLYLRTSSATTKTGSVQGAADDSYWSFAVGGSFRLNSFSSCDVGEMFTYNRICAVNETNTQLAYLTSKWSIG